MAGFSRRAPLCCSEDGFDTGTLALFQSPMTGPVCSLGIEDMIAEAMARGAHTAPKKKATTHPSRKHHLHIAVLKPDPKVMAAVNAELGTKVNFDKLADFEGGQAQVGYIPGHTIGVKNDADQVAGRSGVTIATGFDIGQWSELDLSKKLALSDNLRAKYKRFCNKPKQLAIDEIESKGLTVTKAEADETDMRVQGFHLKAAIATWDSDPKPSKNFVELTMAQQTVILSRTYHQGVGMPETGVAQDFYDAAQKGDWDAAEKALRNYNVKPHWYKVRVGSEADYLAQEALQLKAARSAAPAVPNKP
jgi:Bacterial toxin homologue of phage lysozyme, C-term